MDHQWYYVLDGKSQGPISTFELRQLVARGELRAEDLVWREGMTEWSTVATMRFTPPVIAIPPPVPAPRTAPSRREPHPRRTHAPSNQRVVVWSVVGVVAVLLCVGWMVMARPRAPLREERASGPRTQAANTGDASQRVESRSESAAAASPLPEASVRKPSNSDSVDTTADVAAAPKRPQEIEGPPAAARNAEEVRSEPKQRAPPSVPQPAIPAKQTLFQLVEIRRTPIFSIQGLETRQSLHYQVLSQLDLDRDAESRTTKVVQLVADTRLIAADDSSRASFAKALEGLKRQQYTYRLNYRGEVIEFTGHKESRLTIPLDLASSAGFQLTSVIDEDGWKELAELTFAVPPNLQQADQPWKRQMTHDWGALGSWSGNTTFTPQPPREQLVQIAFAREMNYTAPRSDGGGLPFQIRHAAFELQQASGTIEFDVLEQRVRKATENFDVRGTVSAELAGIGVQIDLSEQQRIEIKLSEQHLSLQ